MKGEPIYCQVLYPNKEKQKLFGPQYQKVELVDMKFNIRSFWYIVDGEEETRPKECYLCSNDFEILTGVNEIEMEKTKKKKNHRYRMKIN